MRLAAPAVRSRALSVPLCIVAAGEKARMDRLTGGAGIQSHLASLGFVPGIEVEVVSRDPEGSFIVGIRTSRLALGHGMARHIWVEQ